MKYAERELFLLKEELNEMWKLVFSQLEKSKRAFLDKNIEQAQDVINREKRVNAYDLKIDRDCENYIALFSPVAVDLRFVLSLIKISNNLERIGDFAESIALYVTKDDGQHIDQTLIEDLQIENIFDSVSLMLMDGFVAFESENTKLSGKILLRDEQVDELSHKAIPIIVNYIRKNPTMTEAGLRTSLLIRRLERIGDHCSNIIEEIVFYVDAKVLKHIQKI